mmetsp:Transcript_11251/g.19835  ORF Transcript_11251/g.19835 Transcript_11251/m.19835 type:complete len:220 (-) Transcript_11251:437-1096(-)
MSSSVWLSPGVAVIARPQYSNSLASSTTKSYALTSSSFKIFLSRLERLGLDFDCSSWLPSSDSRFSSSSASSDGELFTCTAASLCGFGRRSTRHNTSINNSCQVNSLSEKKLITCAAFPDAGGLVTLLAAICFPLLLTGSIPRVFSSELSVVPNKICVSSRSRRNRASSRLAFCCSTMSISSKARSIKGWRSSLLVRAQRCSLMETTVLNSVVLSSSAL